MNGVPVLPVHLRVFGPSPRPSCATPTSSGHLHVILDHPHVTPDHPHVILDHPHVILDHPHVTLDHPHVTLDHPHVTLDHPHVTPDLIRGPGGDGGGREEQAYPIPSPGSRPVLDTGPG